MLAGLFGYAWSFIILFTIIHFGCWFELVKLMKKIYKEKYLLYCLIGVIYISLPIGMMIDLRFTDAIYNEYFSAEQNSKLIPCAILFSIWINDTMAYMVGSLIGKTPFTKISPKKTLEGTIGGAILCVVAVALFAYYFRILPLHDAIAIAAICSIFGTIGDLLESKLKRMAEVKDSGSFMPGHGGFLDRFDSMLIAVPFVWVYIKFFV